jgi:hypothetical protein
VKIKIVIPLILFAIVLNSCTCVETHLTKEEKEWFSAYKKGQTIIFKSNLGNLDSIVIKKIEIHGNKDCNWIEIGTTQNHIMSIDFKPKVCHNESYCDGGISISKANEDKKAFPSFSLFGLFYSKSYNKEKLKKLNIKLITTNKIYYQVYYFENGVNANGFGTNSPKSFYWDKKDGLIKYETKDGEVFELLKETN